MLSAYYDESTGIVLTVADGLASIEAFDDYMSLATEYTARSRIRHGRSLHLVDATKNSIQQRDTFDHMADISLGVVHPDDRFAIIVQSMLARLQIERMPRNVNRQFFADRESASAWLLEEARVRPSSAGAA